MIDASGFSGMSTLTASGSAKAKLIGGPGNDTLSVTGTGPAVLVGNAGNDTLNANGNGRTMLIGGDGADTLTSRGHRPGDPDRQRTSYDSNLAALDAILNEWSSANNYATRISNLLTGGGLAAGYAINSTTVIDDGVANTFQPGPTGNTAARNWFIKKNVGDSDHQKDN